MSRVGARSRWRRVAFGALVIAVVILHGCITSSVAERMDAFDPARASAPRIVVAYVRELAPAAPPAAVAPAAPPVRKARRAAHPKAAQAASAPEPAASAADAVFAQAEAAPDATLDATSDATEAATSEAVAAQAAASEPIAEQPAASQADAAVAAASAPAEAASGAAFEWPVSTRVSYVLNGNYRGEVQGQAQVEWVRVGMHYQVHLDLSVGPSFAPIVSRRMSSDGEIGADGLVPHRFDQDTKVAFGDPRHATMSFDETTVVLANGDRRANMPGMQDTASQFIQMSYLFTTRPELLRVGNHFEVPLALTHRVDRWTYDVLDEDTVYTSFGALPVFHLKPRRAAVKPGDLVPDIWFAPELRYLPVRIRIQQDSTANFVDLLISRRPEMAAN